MVAISLPLYALYVEAVVMKQIVTCHEKVSLLLTYIPNQAQTLSRIVD
jgi:hypothetical protein